MAGKSKMKARKSQKKPLRMLRRKRASVLNARKTDNYATIEETHSVAMTAGTTYNIYHQLTDLVRALTLAKSFQYYRITSIKYRFKPLYDTFSTAYPSQVPQLYYVYDRSNTLPNLSIPQFEQVGVKPIRFDDKIIVKTLRPAVIGEADGDLPAQYRISPWLPCNTDQAGGFTPSDINHYGSVACISKMYATDGTIYDTDVTITVQFKAPLVPASESNSQKVRPPIGHVDFGGQTQQMQV